MSRRIRHLTLWPALALLTLALPASATEVYHWVDENGVLHYSQERPPGDVSGVTKLTLEDPVVPDQPEDIYGVEEQAERIAQRREEMQQRRDEARERKQNAATQPIVVVQQPHAIYPNRWWWPPLYPSPPVRPEPPIEVPYRTSTLAPRNR